VATNGVITYAPSPTRTYIGWDPNYGTYFNGIITDVQIYDVALSSSQVAQLYNAGQFGVPTNITRLDGWWPLNGDTNDYSGNFRLGIPINVVYTGNNIIPATLNNAYLVSSASMPFSIGAGSKPYNVSVISWR
jgi:hypothetical protein